MEKNKTKQNRILNTHPFSQSSINEIIRYESRNLAHDEPCNMNGIHDRDEIEGLLITYTVSFPSQPSAKSYDTGALYQRFV